MNFNFKTKVFLGQLLVIVFFLIFSGVVLYMASDIKNQKVASLETSFTNYKFSQQIRVNVVQIQQFLTDVSATRGEDGLDDGFKLGEENYKNLLVTLAKQKELAEKQNNNELVKSLDEIKKLVDAYYLTGVEMANQYVKNGTKAGNAFMPKFDKASADLQENLKPLLERIEKLNDLDLLALKKEAGLIFNLAIWIPLFTLIAFAIFSFFFINRLNRSLQEVVHGLIDNSSDLEGASLSLYENAVQLSNSVTEQSSAIELSVSAIHEISSTVDSNADYSFRAREAAEQSSVTTKNGIETLGNVLSAIEDMSENNIQMIKDMKEINSEVEEIIKVISDIDNKTKVINEIVFQTKLLSFNASVEAARAGEHGKGFAVVAEEVGNLAQMSGNAAKEVSEMLDHGVSKVKNIIDKSKLKVESSSTEGTRKVESSKKIIKEANSVMDSILVNIENLKNMNNEIANSSKEQSTGVNDINRSFSGINASIKFNAEVAEESTEQSKMLKDQSEKLGKVISNFLLFVEGEQKVQFDFKGAISGHLGWRTKLNNYLANPDASLKSEVVSLDNQCALGKWIYGEGEMHKEKNHESYEELRKSHAEFHKCAGHIIDLINNGKKDQAMNELRPKSDYIQVSKKTVSLIKDLQRKVSGV